MSNNITSRSLLARLLAQENISVGVTNSHTAYFDLKTRFLGLPNFENTSPMVYDMLVAHEISHALYTPEDGWEEFVTSHPHARDVLNIVEDARAEKLVIQKYPGFHEIFVEAYKELHEKDFFGIKGKDVSKLSFTNRANLFFKSRGYIEIPFSEEEKAMVDRIGKIDDWGDVVDMTREIAGIGLYLKSSENGQSPEPDGFDDFFGLGDEMEGLGEILDLEIKPQEGEIITITSDSVSSGDDLPDEDFEQDEVDREFDVQMNFNARVRADLLPGETYVVNCLPGKIYPTGLMKKYKEGKDDLSKSFKEHIQDARGIRIMKGVRKNISTISQEFKMRQAATSYARGKISDSGDIDMNKLYSYRFNDDIFLKTFNEQKGKSHGIYMLVDYSQSMQKVLTHVWEQVLTISDFCRENNIPFKIVTFTSGYGNEQDIIPKGACINMSSTSLTEILSSEMSKDDYAFNRNVLMVNGLISKDSYGKFIAGPMGGTPLGQAFIGISEDVLRLKKAWRVDNMKLFVVTDGAGDGIFFTADKADPSFPYEYSSVIFDTPLGKFKLPKRQAHSSISFMKEVAKQYKQHGIDVFNFHIAGMRYIKNNFHQFISLTSMEFKNKYSTAIMRNGFYAGDDRDDIYDRKLVIYKSSRSDWGLTNELVDDMNEDDKTLAPIQSNFVVKTFEKKRGKLIATKLAEMIA